MSTLSVYVSTYLVPYTRARSYKPTHVLNSAGVTGRPNVDWCEDHKQETIRANVVGYGNSKEYTRVQLFNTVCVHCDINFFLFC